MENDAAQADAAYPMSTIGTFVASGSFADVDLGVVQFNEPVLKIIRINSTASKQKLNVDRLRLFNNASAAVTDKKPLIAPIPTTLDSAESAKTQSTRSATSQGTILWDSSESWNKDRPGLEWLFPFIDQNRDVQLDRAQIV